MCMQSAKIAPSECGDKLNRIGWSLPLEAETENRRLTWRVLWGEKLGVEMNSSQ